MSKAPENILDILSEIETAFHGVPRGKITLHEADAINCCFSDSERAKERQKDTETQWQDVPDAFIENLPFALSFLCPESFRYYIAAYMKWTLTHFRKSHSASINSTIYALSSAVSDEQFLIFSREQKNAIKHFLEYMALYGEDHADCAQAEFALTYYWNYVTEKK